MSNTTQIEPTHALVIGAGPGLGAAVARRFAREGYAVTLVARRQEILDEIAAQVRDAGGTADTVIADASDPKAFRAAMTELAQQIAPGVVVYNAALVASDNVLSSDLDYLLGAYAIDAVGAITTAQVFTPAMRTAHAGTYLVTGGYAWVNPHESYATIALGKAGVRTAVALMHDELKNDGVHATSIRIAGAIAPGTPRDPDVIANTYWALHTQSAGEWVDEIVFSGE